MRCFALKFGSCLITQVMEDNTECPITYASRILTKTEKHYSQIDKEALALIWGVKKFHTYVFARRFTLRTDHHKPLTAIFNPEKAIPATTAARLQRYALFLAGFNYDIEYRSSSSHCNADGLSRNTTGTNCNGTRTNRRSCSCVSCITVQRSTCHLPESKKRNSKRTHIG